MSDPKVLLEDRRQELIDSLHAEIDSLFDKIKDAVADATMPRRGWVDKVRNWWWDRFYGSDNPNHPLYRRKHGKAVRPPVATEWSRRRPSLNEYNELGDYLSGMDGVICENRLAVVEDLLDKYKDRLKKMVTSKVMAMSVDDLRGTTAPEPPKDTASGPEPTASPGVDRPEEEDDDPPGDGPEVGSVGDKPASDAADPEPEEGGEESLKQVAAKLLAGQPPANTSSAANAKTIADLGETEFPTGFSVEDYMALIAMKLDPEGSDAATTRVNAVPALDAARKQHWVDQFQIWAMSSGVRGMGGVDNPGTSGPGPTVPASPPDTSGREVGNMGDMPEPPEPEAAPPRNPDEARYEYGFDVNKLLAGTATPTGRTLVDKLLSGETTLEQIAPGSQEEQVLLSREMVPFKDFIKVVKAQNEMLALNYYMVVATDASKEGDDQRLFRSKYRYTEVGKESSVQTSRLKVLNALRDGAKGRLPKSRYTVNFSRMSPDKRGDWVDKQTFYRFLGEATSFGDKARRAASLLRAEHRQPRLITGATTLSDRIAVYKESLRTRVAKGLPEA